jgi:hypothetical protein
MDTADRGSIFREQRAAKNQSLFREVNERIEPLNEAFTTISKISDFICECANEACTEKVTMTVAEYEVIRQVGNRFVVAVGEEHVWPDVELVVEKSDRYWIVEKLGYGGAMATHLNPRSRGEATHGDDDGKAAGEG